MNATEIKQLFAALAQTFEAEKERLGDLDAVLGDGDHGSSMARGFQKAHEAVKDADTNDVGQLFQTAGRALMSAIGGASGPLFAVVLLELGKTSAERTELTADIFIEGVENAAAAVRRLGKAEVGDKTMLDVLVPVSDALAASQGLTESLKRAARTATDAAASTAQLTAKKGRARYVQGGGLEHPDPGATSVALMFETFYRTHRETSV